MRRLLGLAAVLILAGCGATSERAGSGGPIVPDAPAPPIQAVDEAPSADQLDSLQMGFDPTDPPSSTSTGQYCERLVVWGDSNGINPVASPSVGDQRCRPPTAEEEAQARAEEQRYEDATRPAPDSPPRVLAKLALAGGGGESFIAWRTSRGSLCWETDEQTADGSGGGSGPTGPCEADALSPAEVAQYARYGDVCDAICLQPDSGGDAAERARYVLAGTVAGDADALRVTQAGGATATYPLVGPTIPGTDRRIFLLDLGAHDWRKLELVRGAAVVETETMPASEAAFEDCNDQVGPMPPLSDGLDEQALEDSLRSYVDEIEACVRASAVAATH